MTTNQETQTIDEALNRTDLGHVINENKKPIMLAALLLVIAIIGYSVFNQVSENNQMEMYDRVHKLENSLFTPFLEDKKTANDFIKEFKNINNELVAEPNLVPSFLAAINKLDEVGKMDAALIETTALWWKKTNKANPLYLFLGVRLAALYEDAGKADDAVATLEGLVSLKPTYLKDKIHFDLGRLYLSKGDKKTAEDRFNYIKEKFPNSNFNPLANIYLNGL